MRLFLAVCLLTCLAGCASSQRNETLTAPRTLAVPYDTSRGEVLWAVIPLRNESGTSIIDEMLMSDKLIGAIEETRGLRCLPLNRTLAAMEALELQTVRSPDEARKLAQALGADGIVAGSITSYEPYTPVMGISLALYSRPGAMLNSENAINTRDLARAPADATPTDNDANWTQRPLAVYSERLDAKNHATLLDLKAFAEGRNRTPSALGYRRYTASMALYSEFVMHKGVDGLLQQEWIRVSRGQMPKMEPRPLASER